MAPIPDLIPINREVGHHTHYIGKYRTRKQFAAFVVASFPRDQIQNHTREERLWYAVVHEFDKDGNHLQTRHSYLGSAADQGADFTKRSMKALAKLMEDLGQVRYANIKVKLFSVEIDGRLFGLVDDSDGDTTRVTLWPNDLAFFPPWSGSYDT